MEVSGQLHAPVALPPRERAPGTHWIGGSVDICELEKDGGGSVTSAVDTNSTLMFQYSDSYSTCGPKVFQEEQKMKSVYTLTNIITWIFL
jgi:hypothetical protein